MNVYLHGWRGLWGCSLISGTSTLSAGPLAKDQRAHVHRTIDGYDLPVTHTTRRIGRPFTLVLEKTAILFKRDAAERQRLREDLEWMEKTAAEF